MIKGGKVKKGFLQEVGLELRLGGSRGRTGGITSVSARNRERTWCVHGWRAAKHLGLLAGLRSSPVSGGWDKPGVSKQPR